MSADKGLGAMFAAAGKTKEVPLHVLLATLSDESRKAIVNSARVKMMFAEAGIDRLGPIEELACLVVTYMGWDREDGAK